jgi:hypothetical protein
LVATGLNSSAEVINCFYSPSLTFLGQTFVKIAEHAHAFCV